MADYEPLDLDALRNAPADLFAPAVTPGHGARRLRGIPFDLGPDAHERDRPVWLGFGDGLATEPVTIPIGRPVRRVIVAHALVDSTIPQGAPPGTLVADYVFHLDPGIAAAAGAGGRPADERTSTAGAGPEAGPVVVPIRELFEIGALPLPGGPNADPHGRMVGRIAAHPWLAVPDRYDGLPPRHGGPWIEAGRRMQESEQAFSNGFKLWTWRVPGGAVVEAVTVIPHGPRFAIGGITVGHLDEEPFVRTGREPVVIEVEGEPVDARSLSLHVDRGVATYVWPVVPESPTQFLQGEAAQVAGWGEPLPAETTTATAAVAAVPSATVEVRQGDRVLGTVRWADVIGAGVQDSSAGTEGCDSGDIEDRGGTGEGGGGRVRVRWVDRARRWVHTTVVDEATGRPVPCRIHFRSPTGIPWQPHGHHDHPNSDLRSFHMDVGGDVRLGRVPYAVIDGRCQGWLPEGDVLVEVVRGFEYEPLRAHVQIAPGQRELRLSLRRWADLRAEGWASGDTHVHFLSTAGGHLEARAEDLHVVNLLQAQWGHLFTNAEDFTGTPSVGPDGQSIVFVGQENRQHVLGHLGLLGLRRPVMPWSSDGPGEAEIGGTLETTLSRWADEGREAGALVTAPHFGYPHGELPALIATGRVDALEMAWLGRYYHEQYYRYLNAGYRLPLVGGTDKMSSETPVGIYRTYARLGPDEPLTYDGWARAVAAGRTFLSAGPILRLGVEGGTVGDTLRLPAGGGTVEVHAVAESAAPIHVLQVVVAGRVVAEAAAPTDTTGTAGTAGARRLELRERIRVDEDTWVAARAGGPGYFGSRRTLCSFERGVFAHTSPIYVACGEGPWARDDPATVEYMVTGIEGLLGYVQETAATTRIGGGGHVHRATDHTAWLTEPLHQALHALAARGVSRNETPVIAGQIRRSRRPSSSN